MTSLEEGTGDPGGTMQEHERKLCDWVPEGVRTHCRLKPVVRKGDAAEQILRTAGETDSDLIVIGAQYRPLLEATIFGTTSIRVMRHATCPVLTVPRHAA
jgi:nucleotide-binding universal stress UspA family protein